jgi:hypothetical protein
VGFTPLSVTPFRVELPDDETRESFWVEWPPVQPLERLRLAPRQRAYEIYFEWTDGRGPRQAASGVQVGL